MNHNDRDGNRKEFFNSHAEGWLDMYYRDPETGRLDRHQDNFTRLFSIAALQQNDTVLDAGCGSGVLAPFILDRTGKDGHLYEVDYAENMIAANKRLHPDPRITFLTASVESMDIPDRSVDTAFCFACFPHFQRKAESLKEIKRVLKPGGSLIIAHFASAEEINRRHDKHKCVMHDHLLPETEMRDLLTAAGYHVDMFVDESGFYCIKATNLTAE
jgi:demethylmenaquinone methyltransferase/2-methoxy-6-polyprenyl-1,4-benzoquinol methylase